MNKCYSFNHDGHLDVILAGNFSGFRIPYGRYDASRGVLLIGDGKGTFEEVSNNVSGLNISGEARDISVVKIASGKELLLFSLNNEEVKFYEVNQTN